MEAAVDWSLFDGAPNGWNWDFIVVTHELGHNFGADHTHEYCPPIDTCQDHCEGAAACGSQGTLMSYCHLCPGGITNIDLEFDPFIANVMRGSVNDSCLGTTGLTAGESLDFLLYFDPHLGTGAKSAVIEFAHNGVNTATPFVITCRARRTEPGGGTPPHGSVKVPRPLPGGGGPSRFGRDRAPSSACTDTGETQGPRHVEPGASPDHDSIAVGTGAEPGRPGDADRSTARPRCLARGQRSRVDGSSGNPTLSTIASNLSVPRSESNAG